MQMPDLDELYAEIILDHYRNPRNQIAIDPADLTAEGFNPFCGDRVVLKMGLDVDGLINNVGFQGEGCSISQASASIMTCLLKGRTISEAMALNAQFREVMAGGTVTSEIEDDFGELAALKGVKQFPVRIKCALLPWATLTDAVTVYQTRPN